MGKGKPRAVEKGVSGQNLRDSSNESLNVPLGPVYYPTDIEFQDPLEYVYKIRPEAEKYGICKIVPPKNWKPPFALDKDTFQFPTKTQAIHQLQARPAACDSKTFELEYNRFLEKHCGKKLRNKVVFEEEELDLCKLFNAVKRFGGYDKVVKEKKWKEVFRFVRPGKKISECSKHVLFQLYLEHLYDYEAYYNQLHQEVGKDCKRKLDGNMKCEDAAGSSSSKRRRKNIEGEKIKVSKVKEEERDQICQQCKSGLHGEVMLLCDRCNKGWHIYCLSPPLKQIPPGNWYCLDCLNSDKDCFGFTPGRNFSLEEFRRVAERARKKWFGPGPVSRPQMEKKFWEIVEGSTGKVEAMYGSDLDTSIYGSGFPRVNDQKPESVEALEWDKYCSSPWNLNNLPKLKGSMLRAVHNNITGVMVPWLYVGMLFSSFCWHFEDHCFYSMNYHHWGEPKCWYSIPGSESSAFEKVMRDTLPDLFDAQPDLLFQLVTMLNPSVLQQNAVPVYTVLQEPGNFIITFPRSYHAGFNFGLNCAEAVNFAPADWLPHGRFGAELYQLYHKPPVLSHEELLCVVAKGDCDSRASPYLKDELHRIYNKEKDWRERLWRSGIIKSSPMPPHKYPEYVGTEEDSTCIICQQHLYLSAVVCRCRPSAFVCLEHWDRLCECKSKKLRFLYRHTLSELHDLVPSIDIYGPEELPKSNTRRRQISNSNELGPLTKKVKGSHISMIQLAEKWLTRAKNAFQDPYSSDEYTTLIKEAEQFIWAGPEMDQVREVLKNLIEGKNWANEIRICLTKIDGHDLKKVDLEHVIKLLDFDCMPCNEPGHSKLKDHAEVALLLTEEINSVLSSGSNISELEGLYSRANKLPIYVKEIEKLSQRISSVKDCLDNLTRCVADKPPHAVEVDFLRKLKLQVEELQIQVPETVNIFGLLREAESCQARSREILKGPMNLKDVESFLQEFDNFAVGVPEMLLLKQFHTEAVAWKSQFSDILVNIQDRDDQQNVVDELNSIIKDGASLQIHVDELPLVEAELKKACCREKVLKAKVTKMPLDCIQQLMEEAIILQIDGERLFVDMSGVLVAALHWEDRAKKMLSHGAPMSEFEDALREGEGIGVILPSFYIIDDAASTAKSWLERSKAFLGSGSSVKPASSSLLALEDLKDLVFQSKFLKISLEERNTVETVCKKCEAWQHEANSIVQETSSLFDTRDIDNGLVSRIGNLVTQLECITKVGLSLGYNFDEIPKLRNACSMLQWCKKALTFCSMAPCFEEVRSLNEAGSKFSELSVSGTLWSSVVDGVKWLKKALEIVSGCRDMERCMLSDAEEILAKTKMHKVSFPVVVDQLVKSIEKHKLWKERVHHLFSLKPVERCWFQILQLKELGLSSAFNCLELDMVLSEVEKVEKWKHRCMDVVGITSEYGNSLLASLQKIKLSVDRSLQIYDKSSWSLNERNICISCSTESESNDFLSCSICKDCYHLRCLGPTVTVDTNQAEGYVCPYCLFVEGGVNHGGHLRFGGKRPELKMLSELLSDAENLCVWVEGRDILQDLVGKALACEAHLTEIVDYASSHKGKDLGLVGKKLTLALKAVEVAGVYGHLGNCNLELALARNLWRVKVNRLLESSEKPTMQLVQRHLKEGCSLSITLEDYYINKLTELRDISLQWADQAKKVSKDSGALSLDKVFKLITEGENLPVHLEKELKLLETRSMLHCICRKPYDKKSMVACDKCDEWYHISCVKLRRPPKVYICAACNPETELLSKSSISLLERSTSGTFVEPKTPSPAHKKSRSGTTKTEPNYTQKVIGNANRCSGIERLWWRNRKPFRRSAKKRSEFKGLSTFFE